MIKVQQMQSVRSHNPVANQFRIWTDDGIYFQSYQSLIAFVPVKGDKVYLDEVYWDYSRTTSKYRSEFLGENTAETKKKIRDGIYELVNLN